MSSAEIFFEIVSYLGFKKINSKNKKQNIKENILVSEHCSEVLIP